MPTNFPTTLDSYTRPGANDLMNASGVEGDVVIDNLYDAVEALETKVGINSSAVTTTLDYKITNASSSNPGHVHTLASGATDVTASAAEVNLIDGTVAGTAVASKALALGSNKNVDLLTVDNAIQFNSPQGFMINGKLSVTVSSNNLTVAIKTLSGADPSASNPVYIRIGDTMRSITAATSKTLAAATNYFNSGAAETAAKEVDYFTYAIWNTTPATDRVDIGFARRSTGLTYADFSTTSTGDSYLAFSNSDTPTSTDAVEVIGRFNATLSAGAGYTWSIPATAVVVNYPIFMTRTLTWQPTYTGFSVDPSGVYRYQINRDQMWIHYRDSANGTSNTTSYTGSLPLTAKNVTNGLWNTAAFTVDNGSAVTTAGSAVVSVAVSRTIVTISKDFSGGAGTFTNANGKRAVFQLFYEV